MEKIKLKPENVIPDLSNMKDGDINCIAEGLEELIYNFFNKENKSKIPP